jgi:hypothetical protein
MDIFRRNVPLLAGCQALMLSGNSLIITTAALVGFALAEDKAWATMPLAIQFIATMCTTVPAALLMDRIGRRQGFILATLFGISGAAFATLAILKQTFFLFAFGTLQIGIFNGFGNYYRFAAADAVAKDLKGRAVSYIMAGGVIAAFVGPNLANTTRGLFSNAPFAGSYAALVILYSLSLGILAFFTAAPQACNRGYTRFRYRTSLENDCVPADVHRSPGLRHAWLWSHGPGYDGNTSGNAPLGPSVFQHFFRHPVACSWHVRACFYNWTPRHTLRSA